EVLPTFGDRLLALALPARDGRQRRDPPRLDLEVEVLGEPLDQAESLGERCPALEPHLEAGGVQRPEAVRDPVVLLHEPAGEATVGGNDLQEIVELGILVDEAHAEAVLSADSTSACVALVPYRLAISRSRSR